MNFVSNGKIVGEIKQIDTGIEGVMPLVVIIITDEELRKDILDKMEASGFETEDDVASIEYEE